MKYYVLFFFVLFLCACTGDENRSSNAETFHTDYNEELHRTIIHGILHLCGINDKGPGEREIMEENENRALAILPEECRG